jgi:hypothetical protein
MQHLLMAPEYLRYLSQLSSYMNDLPSPLTNIIVEYFNPSKHTWLQTVFIVATTTDGHVVVVDPSTKKELRRVPLTPQIVKFLDRNRSFDVRAVHYRNINQREENPLAPQSPQWGISPIDYNTLIRVDIVYDHDNMEHTNVSWIQLDGGLGSSSPTEGKHCISLVKAKVHWDVGMARPWFSWCGRYDVCFLI